MGSWCTSIVTPGKMVGIVYTMRRMRKLPSYSKHYYTKSYTNIFDRWGYPSSACGKNNLDRLKLNELEQLKYKKRNKYNLIIILVDICSKCLEFIDFFGNFAWVKGHLITLPTFTQTGGREVGNSNYVRNIHHFPPWRRWWPRQSPGNQSCTWKHLMMTVYWGRLSEALSDWNKSCLVDFFHCSKNIRTLACDTEVREEQNTVPIWMSQRTPEISTAMNISGKTPQHSLPSFNRKKNHRIHPHCRKLFPKLPIL